MAHETTVLEITGLSKRYAQGGGVQYLNLTIEQGTSFGLLGPNGAGKSTTLKMIMGLFRPTAGSINVLGHDVLAEPESVRRKVGYVPEDQRMYPWMTVAQLVWFARSFYPTWDDALCKELLRDYGLAASKKVRELSNGMQTKLALVLALSHNPQFLVLDEPTTGLDPLVREEFLEKVQQMLRARRRTVLFSSHIMSDVEKIADTIGIMNDGRMLAIGGRTELMEETNRIHVVLDHTRDGGIAPGNTIYQTHTDEGWILTVRGNIDAAVSALRNNNRVLDLSVTKPSLEEIFKDYIRGQKTS